MTNFDVLTEFEGDHENEVEAEEEEEEDSQEEGVREEGERDESEEIEGCEQLTVHLLVTLRHSVGFSFASTAVLPFLEDLPGTGLVSLATGDVAGAGRHPGTKCTILTEII